MRLVDKSAAHAAAAGAAPGPRRAGRARPRSWTWPAPEAAMSVTAENAPAPPATSATAPARPLDRLPDHHRARVRPHHPHLGPDHRALGGDRHAVLRDLRQPDRPARRRDGRLRLHAVHRARPDHDGGDHQLPTATWCPRSSAPSSSATSRRSWSRRCRTGSSSPATSAAAWCAGWWSAGVVTVVSFRSPTCSMHHGVRDRRRGAVDRGDLRARRLHQRGVRQELRPGELGADLHRADAADIFRRRVLLHLAAAGLGAEVSFANPILHMVNAFRYGFLGTSDVDVGLAFGIMALARRCCSTSRSRVDEPRHRHARD